MKTFYMTDNNVCVPYKIIMGRLHKYYEANGCRHVSDPANAETIIVGLCGAFHSMTAHAISLLKEARTHRQARVVAFGCLNGIAPEIVANEKPDLTCPSPDWRSLASLVSSPSVLLEDIAFTNELRDPSEYRHYDPGRKFLLIQTGCSSNCPHCPHKLGIGELQSIPLAELMGQMRSIVDAGAHTVTVHGNDTGSYGTDGLDCFFPCLVERLLEFPVNIHLSQINADWAYAYRDELKMLLLNERIKEFQVLIQSSSDRLLTLMQRKPVVRHLEEFLSFVRGKRPDMLLRTDLIVGYPTSTPEEDMESVVFAGKFFDEIAVHGFETFPNAPIANSDIEKHPQKVRDLRVEMALEHLLGLPDKVIHRGGQVYQTMEDMEGTKECLRNKKQEGFTVPKSKKKL